MAQVLKKELRDRILRAALEVFAAQGYLVATMGSIAERAGLGTASLYRYYPGKADLFAAVIPQELVDQFDALLTRRVRALGRAASPTTDPSGEEMLQFWITHRLEVVILLERAAGTPYADFGARFVDNLTRLTLEQFDAVHGTSASSKTTSFVLRAIFENTRRMIASILEMHTDERDIRRAIETFWAYQIAGLRGLSAQVVETPRRKS
jgi:AcrR family transcriptional regulator